jgi:hypothetical protein
MADVNEDHQEIAAAILAKASRAVSFAYTPATKRPRLADVVIRSAIGGIDLGARFKSEETADNAASLEEELEHANSEDWTEGDDPSPSSAPFVPSIAQWNLLVKKVGTLTQELEGTRNALSDLAQGSDVHLEGLDDQVADLRSSVGRGPTVLNPNVSSMELWMSVTGLSQTLHDLKYSVDNPLPKQFDLATRSIADNAARDANVARERASDLMQSTRLAGRRTIFP